MSVGDTDLAILLTNFGKSLPGGTPAAPTTTGAPVFGTTLSAAPAAPMTSGGDPSGDDQVDLITAAEPSAADRNEASAPSPLARGWGHRTHGLRAQLAAAAQDGRRGRRPHTTRPIMAAIERPSVAGLDWVRLRDLSAIGTVSGTMLQSTRR
jgi:hypothetical protein